MAIFNKDTPAEPPVAKIEPYIEDRIKRGAAVLESSAAKRDECYEFWRGNQYVELNKDGKLINRGVVRGAPGKPDWTMRRVQNLIVNIVAGEVSMGTARVPGYQVIPTTSQDEDIGAAHLSSKIARYGYNKWELRRHTQAAWTHAVVGDMGFAFPYFDNTVGPLIDAQSGVCEGDVKVKIYSAKEVIWEEGCDFYDSPWHATVSAQVIESVTARPGFVAGALVKDAEPRTIAGKISRKGKGNGQNLVMVTDYLERSTRKYPDGRRLVMANGKLLFAEEKYPCNEGDDTPALLKLGYFADPDSDRDQGLVRHELDGQRLFNSANNKAEEWANLALNPQMIGPVDGITRPLTAEPGAYIPYEPIAGMTPQWREIPRIPPELFQIADRAQGFMNTISAQSDIPPGVESAKALQMINEKDQSKRAAQFRELADFHSRLMRKCLLLVQKHYTENRIIAIQGSFAIEYLDDFKGADLRDQVDVRVDPESLEPQTRDAVERRVMGYAQMGWVTPEDAMAAINAGVADQLIEDYQLQIKKQNREIQEMINGGYPDVAVFDSHALQMKIMERFMVTEAFEQLEDSIKERFVTHYEAHDQAKTMKEAKDAQEQMQRAQSLGMGNAASPQGPPSSPGFPANGDNGASADAPQTSGQAT